LCVGWDFYSHIRERQAWDCARDAADLLSLQQQVISLRGLAVDLQHAQPAVHLAAIALPGDRLLARIAAFAEADVRLVETGFCGQDAIVDLSPPARDARFDPPALELLLVNLFARRPLVEHFFAAEDQPRLVLLGLDLRFRGEAQPDDELVLDGQKVGRITSVVPGLALAYVRVEVPADAQLEVGAKPGFARLR
jgi:hypothetical protein